MRGCLCTAVLVLAQVVLCVKATTLHVQQTRADSIVPTDLAAAFQASSWIWTPEPDLTNVPQVERVFRSVYNAPTGKSAIAAQVLITCDNYFTLYANGMLVDSVQGSDINVWEQTSLYNLTIASTPSIIFAVSAFNLDTSAAGLIAAIKIIHSDGSSTVFGSDTTAWSASKTFQDGWESSTNVSFATPVAVASNGQGAWGTSLVLPASVAKNPPANTVIPAFSSLTSTPSSLLVRTLSVLGKRQDPTSVLPNDLSDAFKGASWIWTPEPGDLTQIPQVQRLFRTVYAAPPGKSVTSAMVLITCDNYYTLYVNGMIVDAAYNSNNVFWQTSFLYNVNISPTPSVVFGVRGFNLANSTAALIAAIKITHSDETTLTITTGVKGWTGSKAVMDGWESLKSDSWDPVQAISPYGQGPWGTAVSLATAFAPNPPGNVLFPSSSNLTEATTTSSSPPQSPTTSSPSTNSSIPSSASKLGTGAIVGISLGAAAAITILASLAYLLRRRLLRNEDDSESDNFVRTSPATTPFALEMQQQPPNPGFFIPDPTYQSHPQHSSSATTSVGSGAVFHADASMGELSPPAYESHTQQSRSVSPSVGYVSISQADPFSDPKLPIPHVLAYNPES